MQDIEENRETSKNKKKDISARLDALYRRYDGTVPKDEIARLTMPSGAEAEKWLRFWRGQVLHAVYALRRQKALRYDQRTRHQFRQWRGGVIRRHKTLTSALRTYRTVQQQKNRPEKPGRL